MYPLSEHSHLSGGVLRRARRAGRLIMFVGLAASLSACGSWVKTPGAGSAPAPGGNAGAGSATLDQIQQEIFTPYCADCHAPGGTAPMPLTDAVVSYASLVDVDPTNTKAREAGKRRVVPGDLAKSFLLQKITGETQFGEGDPMPPGAARLSTEKIALLRRWISDGAPYGDHSGHVPGAAAPGTIQTIAGQTYPGFNGDSKPLTETQLYWPQDMVFDASGALYVADWNNHRVRKADSLAAPVRTVFGESKLGYDPVNHPCGVTLDPRGQVIVAAWHNFSIYRLRPGQGPELVAGNRTQGLSGDGGPANRAQCDFPSSASYDAFGNLYISDQGNRRIRKVDTSGIITTFAGRGDRNIVGFAGDGGPATEALFDCDRGSDAVPGFKLEVDRDLNRLYICDTNNHRVRVIDLATGIINTFAGNGSPTHAGDGGPATNASLNRPTDVAVAPDRSVYIADAYNHVVRRVDPSGIITTVAGVPRQAGFGGDGGPATAGKLNLPGGIYVDRAGNLYIADVLNNRIRLVRARP